MEGNIFRLKREEIEGIYEDINSLIMKNSLLEAKKN